MIAGIFQRSGLRRTGGVDELGRVRQAGWRQGYCRSTYPSATERDGLRATQPLVAHLQRSRPRTCGFRGKRDLNLTTAIPRERCATVVV